MNLTRLFVGRPALVFVFMALVAIFGIYSCATLIQEQFPNVDLPVVAVELTYIGASSTEMRDAIVRPIEDAIAGAPDLDYVKSTIQQGQASIAATFTLSSDKNTDLVEVQRRVQSAQSELPADVRSPVIGTFDPSQSVVTTIVVTSKTLPEHALAGLVTHDIVPLIEQVPGISTVQTQGAVTPALVVSVDPQRLAATNATLTDVINAVADNNARTPGGYTTSNGKETSIDVRGDIVDADSVLNLLLPNVTTPNSASTQVWTSSPALLHISDVAHVAPGYELPRSFAFFSRASGDYAQYSQGDRSERSDRFSVGDRRVAGTTPRVSASRLCSEYRASNVHATAVDGCRALARRGHLAHGIGNDLLLTFVA